MIKVKFGDFMEGKYKSGAWSLYVVRDTDDYVLYVGISESHVSARWWRISACMTDTPNGRRGTM